MISPCVQGAAAIAAGEWTAALERLLCRTPNTRRDKQLWLDMLPAISAVLATRQAAEVMLLDVRVHKP